MLGISKRKLLGKQSAYHSDDFFTWLCISSYLYHVFVMESTSQRIAPAFFIRKNPISGLEI
jgi:hypothetical protein